MTPLLPNPAVRLEARLFGPVDGDVRRTHFVLAWHPEVAAWLLTILEFILYRQGRLAEERAIGAPPGGATLERLVAGGVILSSRRPDGGEALRLNPGFQATLFVSARVPGGPARETTFALGDDTDLARWLLDGVLAPGSRQAPPPATPLADALVRHGLLVTTLPAPAACLPDPAATARERDDVLATAGRVITQAAGTPVPREVRELLGRHVPPVPAGIGLWWAVDAGSGVVIPVTAGATPPAPGYQGAAAAGRARDWAATEAAAADSLKSRRHATLRAILAPGPRESLRRYVRALVDRGYFPALGDGQVELRAAIHNEPAVASLHQALAAIVSRVAGEPLLASYCYLSCYEAGATLPPHKDRPQCSYNLSLVLDMQGPTGEPEPWPIWLEVEGRPEAVLLAVGDGLTYSGTELLHWREALPAGHRALVCFFHFVPTGFGGSLD